MATYTVLLQQYVEMTASVEIEADTPEEARYRALNRDPGIPAEWGAGDDATKAEAYAVMQDAEVVWER